MKTQFPYKLPRKHEGGRVGARRRNANSYLQHKGEPKIDVKGCLPSLYFPDSVVRHFFYLQVANSQPKTGARSGKTARRRNRLIYKMLNRSRRLTRIYLRLEREEKYSLSASYTAIFCVFADARPNSPVGDAPTPEIEGFLQHAPTGVECPGLAPAQQAPSYSPPYSPSYSQTSE